MNIHQEILAKSEQNGRICLYQHLKNVADIARVVANHQCLDEEIAVEGALLHDIGKTSPLFQQSIISPNRKRPGADFRHEIASLFFISLVKEKHRNAVIDMVVAFGSDTPRLTKFMHKSLCGPGSISVAHTPREYVLLSDLEKACRQYKSMVINILNYK